MEWPVIQRVLILSTSGRVTGEIVLEMGKGVKRSKRVKESVLKIGKRERETEQYQENRGRFLGQTEMDEK